MTVEFRHGALCDEYEKQANDQGLTFGDDADWIQKVGFGLVCAHVHGCITDGEYDKILQRFQRKILLKKLKRLPESEEKEVRMTRENFNRWLKTQPLGDKIVYIRYKYSYETEWTHSNECLEVDVHSKSCYIWSRDWNEGQEDVEILGCIDLTEIDVPLFDLHTENEVEVNEE